LEVVQKWDGKTPLIVGGNIASAGMILPLSNRGAATNPVATEGVKP
jgi:hypothetical protein